jgi:hypothetical protein
MRARLEMMKVAAAAMPAQVRCCSVRPRLAASPVSSSAAPPIVYEVLGSPGQPLVTATRASMKPRSGHDVSHARAICLRPNLRRPWTRWPC